MPILSLTFLNAGFLFAALAALLPLVIHLISRRRMETVDFSSIRFLKELERKRVRRIRLSQILLLVVRSLVLLAIALALARPTLRGTAAGAAHARTSAVIVIDTSASMSRQGERVTLFDEALDVCREIAWLTDEGDQVFVVDAAAPPGAALEDGTFGRRVLLEVIDGLEPGSAATDYAAAVGRARELLADARNLNREIYVVGDLQRSGWIGREPRGPGRSAERSEDGPATRVYLVALGHGGSNAAVSRATVSRRHGGPPGRFAIVCGVANYGRRTLEAPVRLFVDGKQVGQSGVRVEPGRVVEVSFAVAVDPGEWHAGFVELPPDALEIDNRRYFVIPAGLHTEVLVVAADGRDHSDGAYYLTRALDPSDAGDRYRPVVIEASALADQDRGRYPVVVLADPGRLGAAGRRWLEGHAREGGGCLAILGGRTDVRFWNSDLAPALGAPAIVAPFEREPGARLAPAAPDHPLLEGLVVGERLIDDVGAGRGFALDAPESESVLEFPGIGPALTYDRGRGGGPVSTLATGLDPEWCDLPKSGLVVPLLDRLLSRLAFVVGEEVAVFLSRTPAGAVAFETPEGVRGVAELRSSPREVAVVPRTRGPGVYRLIESQETLALAAVNVDPAESDLDPAAPDEIEETLGSSELRLVPRDQPLSDVIMESRRGREVWRVLIYCALGLVAVEMLLARPRLS